LGKGWAEKACVKVGGGQGPHFLLPEKIIKAYTKKFVSINESKKCYGQKYSFLGGNSTFSVLAYISAFCFENGTLH